MRKRTQKRRKMGSESCPFSVCSMQSVFAPGWIYVEMSGNASAIWLDCAENVVGWKKVSARSPKVEPRREVNFWMENHNSAKLIYFN